ncbi:MAG TPA: NADH-quinone oxidoreductase subunit J, partial [Kofleriaceae bacterium]
GWPRVEAVVRAALPTATVVRCPKRGAEFEIVHNTSVPLPIDVVEVQAVLRDGRIATLAVVPDNAELKQDARVQSISYRHSDLTGSSGGGMALLFWLFALASVAGAVFVITRRNLIAAVMGMVGSFLGIAAIYMMLYAQFLAVIQMLVYAGAIMVLFVFVVMILNRPEDEPVAPSGRVGQAIGGLAILYLIYRLCVMLAHVEPANPDIAMNAPAPLPEQCVQWRRDDSVPRRPGEPPPQVCERFSRPDWGSIAAVGTDLFGAGLFPFEAISILLLVAVVGAIAIARPLRPDGDAEADTDADAGHSEGRVG